MAASSRALAPIAFQSTTFDVVDHNGQPWLRLHQIGVALGYKRPAIVGKLFAANAAEFTDRMTAVVKLPTAGGLQDVRIFSLRGAHLLGMLARTPVAAEFRSWVLDVLEQQAVPAPMPAVALPHQLRALGLANAVASNVQQAVFVRAMQGSEDANYINQRWLVSLDSKGAPQVQAVPPDASVLTRREFIHAVTGGEGGPHVSSNDLTILAIAAVSRLAERHDALALKVKKARAV